ncbi:aminotransferase class I/II-fold pyridoxal phosphate-dependent enzyme [Rossellomorea aquimaris]|uniref:aminotransferase class I/II-fold pyridoxal phosphate-dependent enzyme n=1 Tax=Rossellomorea aquimaris TaxID=189382 RepID=UPI001CD31B9C|nr:aminotransferase class I/II-fold pyridoxal phosphate-dependent enzyme [Rossellomorea aquimaris]MCA1057237.1 aminotransferase class I/II-fold pyridoxal phosphate-dependent enzyme [Rossellomorea aquimaris]
MKYDQSRMPLIEAMEAHLGKDPISFHVPGHKNGLLMNAGDKQSFYQRDLTELSGLDDLHDPHEAISEAEMLLSDLYGSRKSFLLVNGSTVGNIASILATCSPGDTVLVQRNCHKSVLNGIRLARAVPVLVETDWDEEGKMPVGVSLTSLKATLKAFPDAKACVLTYPTYYGMTYDVEALIAELHQHGVVSIIDEAHGPHFQLGRPFPDSALKSGGDIVIHSAHKMLPAMTMGSYLHIGTDRVNEGKVREYLSILQSSSPSYPIMASLDYARSYLGRMTQSDLKRNLEEIDGFVQAIQDMKNGLGVRRTPDPLKLLFYFDGKSGYELQQLLEAQGVFCELADPFYVLLILPLVKGDRLFPYKEAVDRIRTALKEEEASVADGAAVTIERNKQQHYTTLAISLDEMDAKEVEWVSLSQAEGEISARMIIPYPPGIPLLIPGERISGDTLVRLRQYVKNKASIQGEHRLEEGYICVFR